MKQAYTNTIRGGGARNPLTISTPGGGGGGRGGGRGMQRQSGVPKCAYGAACTRNGCAYRHPDPADVHYDSYHEDPRSKICKPYLAGMCTYGHRCMNRHPPQAEADAVRAQYKEKLCTYGDDCQTEGCLYWHPWEAAVEQSVEGGGLESEYNVGEVCNAIGGLNLKNNGGGGVPTTYEQWLLLNCPPPQTMDESRVYKIWHYPGSGIQRSPWDVYCLMYPPQTFSNNGTTLNPSSSQRQWEPEIINTHGVLPQSWESTGNVTELVQSVKNDDPKTFQEWKKKGQPYPAWFCSDLDPWYDDEGVRRSLEEVYEVLYGESAQENYERKMLAQSFANDPTPAEVAMLLSNTNSNDPLCNRAPAVKEQPASPKRGWANIAAKAPVPIQKPAVVTEIRNGHDISSNNNSNNNSSSIATSVETNPDQKRNMVVIPKEVWLPSTANADCFHLYPNPIERFKAVNNHHKSYLASVDIPLSFDNNSNNLNHNHNNNNRSTSPTTLFQQKGKVAVLDVHFQSAKTVTPVLNRFLVPALKKNYEVWIITGSGHHVAVGHQRREGGGVLFNAVKRYLEDHSEELALEFRIGKDTSGGKNKSSGGALLVRKAVVT